MTDSKPDEETEEKEPANDASSEALPEDEAEDEGGAEAEDEAGGDGGGEANAEPVHPASTGAKVWLCLFLVVVASVSMTLIYRTINEINTQTFVEVSTPWQLPDGFQLRDGPPSFRYDVTEQKLAFRGPITTERKAELRELLAPQAAATEPDDDEEDEADDGAGDEAAEANGDAEPPETSNVESTPTVAIADLEAARSSYGLAIDQLAYLSNALQIGTIRLVLLLGLFGGMLGAILRSLVDFVGHACYKGSLDLVKWWPLYATRPVVGGVLGFILVVLFKAELLTSGELSEPDDSFWWLGIAVIGGFSTVDVTLRLRLAAKALFGVESGGK